MSFISIQIGRDKKQEEKSEKVYLIGVEDKVKHYNRVVKTTGLISMKTAAKSMFGKGCGRTKFMRQLRSDKYLMPDNEPYQRFIEQGLFEVKEYYVWDADITTYTPFLTQKGLAYFIKKYPK